MQIFQFFGGFALQNSAVLDSDFALNHNRESSLGLI